MADCSKNLTELTPYEAFECFRDADDWTVIANNFRRMWSDFTQTTIGEWIEIFIAFAILPAILISMALPFLFIYAFIKRYMGKRTLVPTGNERRYKLSIGIYLVSAAIALILLDSSAIAFGGWILVCGVAVLLLRDSWWAPTQGDDATRNTTAT